MGNIGGNITGIFQAKTASGKNAIGEAVVAWENVYEHIGWLGMQSGDSKHSTYLAKIEESTHVFLMDYDEQVYSLASQDVRMVIKGMMYDVTFIDNPDEMNEQLEIYLRKVGVANG